MGHGKGPCHGIGGNNLIKTNKLITNAQDFCKELEPTGIKSTLIKVDLTNVEEGKQIILTWNTPMVKGLVNIHAIFPVGDNLMTRNTSRFSACCHKGDGIFIVGCPGWMPTGLEISDNNSEAENDEDESEKE